MGLEGAKGERGDDSSPKAGPRVLQKEQRALGGCQKPREEGAVAASPFIGSPSNPPWGEGVVQEGE